MVEHHGSRMRGIHDVGEGEPCVVRGGVEIRRAAGKPVRPQPGLGRQHAPRAERAMAGDVAKQREQIVEPESRPELPARNACTPVHRPGERQRPHEMRRDAQQDAALTARLEHEMEESVLQIPHASVHEPRGAARRSAGKIVALQQRDLQPAQCGVPRNARAVDSAADYQNVKWRRAEPLAGGVAPANGTTPERYGFAGVTYLTSLAPG
jgi:hypothetical protein